MRCTLDILLPIAVALTFIVGCTPNGQSPNGKGPGQLPVNPPKSQGTVDSGGGNTFMGKPLESYAIKLRELQAFKENISPILESEGFQGSSLKNVLTSIIDKKTWYLIPSELKQLPSEKIASAVGTDQAALQDFKQVWLNQNIFDKMTVKDQSVLILHELLMGLRLLKFDSALDECNAFRAPEEKDFFCKNSYSTEGRGKPSDLSVADYAQIRAATTKLIENGQTISVENLNDLLGVEGFSTDDHRFEPKTSRKTISLETLAKMIQTSKLTNSWPELGYDFGKFISDHPELLAPGSKLPNMMWRSDRKCDFGVDVTSDTFSISLIEGDAKKTYSTKWTREIEANLQKDQFEGRYFYEITTPTLKMSETNHQGDEALFVTLKFMDDFLQGAYFEKAVCLDSRCGETGAGPTSFKVMCYTRASLQLKSK